MASLGMPKTTQVCSSSAIVWAPGVDAASGLASLRGFVGDDDVLVEAELQRLAHPVRRPDGWSYLWLLGDSDIFTAIRSITSWTA